MNISLIGRIADEQKAFMSKYQLRFFFDAGSGVCFWAANDPARERFDYAIGADELPLTAATRQAIEELIRRYDTSFSWDHPGGPGAWSVAEWHAFDNEVRHILPVVRQELGSDFEVIDEHRYTRTV